jgi:hypothetical protein
MIGTPVRPVTRIDPPSDLRSKRSPAGGRRRIAARLWTMLNAQSLINGGLGGYDHAHVAEDDSRRMAGRRAS